MDFYTRKPRGFAFVEFYDHRDARWPRVIYVIYHTSVIVGFVLYRSALYALDRYTYDGRELGIVFAKDKRKTSEEMRRISNVRERSRDREPRYERRDDRRSADRRDGSRERRGSREKDIDK